jgi:hypothetical protein
MFDWLHKDCVKEGPLKDLLADIANKVSDAITSKNEQTTVAFNLEIATLQGRISTLENLLAKPKAKRGRPKGKKNKKGI